MNMKVQKLRLKNGYFSWCVLDANLLPIQPIQQFINYLFNLERSPNTLKTYAYHLKLFWEFLGQGQLEWRTLKLEDMAHFTHWLRAPDSNSIPMHRPSAMRTEITVNAMLAAVTTFYKFHATMGTISPLNLYISKLDFNPRYKSYLHHLNRHNSIKVRQVKLKTVKQLPKTLNSEQLTRIFEACKTQRDTLLIYLLYETGMRIGQALGLQHRDIRSWDNEIHIIPRFDNLNGARTKSLVPNILPVSQNLMHLYTDYIVNEYGDIEGDYVFVCLRGQYKGQSLTYYAVQDLFGRISDKVGFKVTPHMLRHTHATELLRHGWDTAQVQKRLGHRDIQTTANTYIHLSNQDLKEAFKSFEKTRKTYDLCS